MESTTRRAGRPPGPPKTRITLYLYDTTLAALQSKADAKGEGLPAYLARNVERLAAKL